MTMDPQPTTEIKTATGWVMALSIGLVVLSSLPILMPGIASSIFTSAMGWIAVISGILQILQTYQARVVRAQWLSLGVGLLYVVAGLYILFNLAKAAAVLPLAFGILFIVEGIFTIAMAFVYRAGLSMSWFVAINGIITLILGILVINRWPFSSLWLTGFYVGISLFFSGASLLGAAVVARREVA